MTCPVALLHANVGRMVAAFMAECPGVAVHLEATNRRVDPVGEAIDLALRVRPPPLADSDLVMRVLAERRQCLVAAPALVKRLGRPDVPAALAAWPSLGLGAPQEDYQWRLLGPGDSEALVPHSPRFVSDDIAALREAAVAGVGALQVPAMMIVDELARGELVEPLPGWAPRAEIVHAVYPSRRGQLPSDRALHEHLAASFAALPAQ
jgi:DNA-binding transcriptional LysR family regulator